MALTIMALEQGTILITAPDLFTVHDGDGTILSSDLVLAEQHLEDQHFQSL